MVKRFLMVAVAALLALPISAMGQNFGTNLAFQWDIRGYDALFSHTPSDPVSDWTFIGNPAIPPGTDWNVIAADTDSTGVFYGVEFSFGVVGTIDGSGAEATFTEVAALSGNVPAFVAGMTIDHVTDEAWVTDGTGLWTLDIVTGVCAQISPQFTNTNGGGAVGTIFELATDGAGNFWAFDITLDTLWSLDIATGDVTELGVYPGPGDPNFSNNGMDWDPVSGQLIGDVYTGSGSGNYGVWDTNTGSFASISLHSAYPLAVGGPIGCFGGTTFQLNFWANTYVEFDTLNPGGGVSEIPKAGVLATPAIFAMDFNPEGSVLFAIDAANDNLVVIDITTGDFTVTMPLVGDILGNDVVRGMTCDPTTGDFYICNQFSLFSLDVLTGDTVLIADFDGVPLFQVPDSVTELACDNNGDMYITTIGDDALYSVDKSNAESTFLGFGPDSNFIQGLDFDPVTNELYGSFLNIDGSIGLYGTWNTTTGVFTTIVDYDSLPQVPGGPFEFKLAIQPIQTGPVTVTPDTVTVTEGTYVSGDVGDLADSDNSKYSIRRRAADFTSQTEFVVTGTSPTETPSAFEVTLEGSAFFRSTVNQTIEVFDYDAGAYVLVDTRAATRTDSVVSIAGIGGDLARFVDNGTREVKMRINYTSVANRQNFRSNTDQTKWTINQ